MTIEQKAQRYDEAIEQGKHILKTPYTAHWDTMKEVVEHILPGLKESEDERIIRAIDEAIKDAHVNTLEEYGSSCKEARTWLKTQLEKQGETMEINPTEFDTRLQALIGKFSSLPKEELIGSLSFWLNVVQNDGTYKADGKQGEQKPILEDAAKAFLEALSETPYNNTPIVEAQIITKQLLIFLSAPKFYNPDAINEQKPADNVEPKFHEGEWITIKE